MAITLVGQGGVAGQSLAAPGPTISYSSAGGTALILAGFMVTASASIAPLSSVTDSAGNTWQFPTGNANNPPCQIDETAGQSLAVFVAWVLNAAAVTSVSLAGNGGNQTFWRVALAEFSGIDKADAGIAALSASGANPSASVTAALANELIVGVQNSNGSSATNPPAGWTEFSGAGSVAQISYDLPVGPGLVTAQWTMPSSDSAIALMTFKPPQPPQGGPAVIAALKAAGVL